MERSAAQCSFSPLEVLTRTKEGELHIRLAPANDGVAAECSTYWNQGYGYQQGYGPGYGSSDNSPHGYYSYGPGYYYRRNSITPEFTTGEKNHNQFYFHIIQKHMVHRSITKEAKRGQVKRHQAEGAQHGGSATETP
ncbi:Btb/Poz Domain-Containing Protein Kctd19 [Manis pentadactyla]|nr:Btb/Poz Domain-Containing Protein Kctd19 [Manis pentadactyla]